MNQCVLVQGFDTPSKPSNSKTPHDPSEGRTGHLTPVCHDIAYIPGDLLNLGELSVLLSELSFQHVHLQLQDVSVRALENHMIEHFNI